MLDYLVYEGRQGLASIFHRPCKSRNDHLGRRVEDEHKTLRERIDRAGG